MDDDLTRHSSGAATGPATQCAATCKWATPTLFVWAPYWFESEEAPWTCLREGEPRVLASTDECATCAYWESREHAAAAAPGPVHPAMPDWFGASPLPHEVD